MNNIAPTPVPMTETQAALERINNLVGTLEGMAGDVENKLYSVMHPAEPTRACCGAIAAACTASGTACTS